MSLSLTMFSAATLDMMHNVTFVDNVLGCYLLLDALFDTVFMLFLYV